MTNQQGTTATAVTLPRTPSKEDLSVSNYSHDSGSADESAPPASARSPTANNLLMGYLNFRSPDYRTQRKAAVDDDTPTRMPPDEGVEEKEQGSSSVRLEDVYEKTASISVDVEAEEYGAITNEQLLRNVVLGVLIAIICAMAIDVLGPRIAGEESGRESAAETVVEAVKQTARSFTETTEVETVATTNVDTNEGMKRVASLMRGPGKLVLVALYFGTVHVAITTSIAAHFTGLGFLLGNTLPPPPAALAPKNVLGKAARWVRKALKL